MFVYVVNKNGKPLMPCKPVIARLLLKDGNAKVKRRTPFTIKLTIDTTEYLQPIIAGLDTGSKIIGCAALMNNKVVYQSEIQIRQDVSKKMKQRKIYRISRRSRKCRYRQSRWLNRASICRKGRLAPSIKSKLDSHLREKKQVESILPINHWKVEVASFDIYKITNPDVKGKRYQQGKQLGFYNTKAYILYRDNYKCQSKQNIKHSVFLHVHHIISKSNGGTNIPSNLITLCKYCHDNLHAGKFEIKTKRSKTKHAAEINIINSQLIKSSWNFEQTYGYETKFKREQILKLPKSHSNDAVAICYRNDELILPLDCIIHKRHVSKGDYKQTSGKRSEKKVPTGKLFGLKKFDLIKTIKGTGWVKGKRSNGFFALMDIFNKTIKSGVNIKKGVKRLSARSTTLQYSTLLCRREITIS